MKKVYLALYGLAMVLALVAVIRPAAAAPAFARTDLDATLTGAAEVPDPGDPDGAGAAAVIMDSELGQACYGLSVSNITLPAAAAHIHEGAAGVAGPVVVPFTTAPDANGDASGCVAVEAALMQRIIENPANFYVNVHTSDFPAGAIRGQLAVSSTPTTVPATGAADSTLLLSGLALLSLVMGLGFNITARRRLGAR